MYEKLAHLLGSSMPLMAQGALLTIKISLITVIIGVVGGMLFGVANSRRLRIRGVSHFINGYTTILRGTPIYVQILIVYFALPDLLGIHLSAVSAGILALSANSIAYMGELVRGGVNAIPEGQWEAAFVLGYSRVDTIVSIILPQMVRNVLPAITNELVTMVKETSILSSVGVLELTRVSRDIISRELDPMTIYLTVALFYLLITTTISLLATQLERWLHHD